MPVAGRLTEVPEIIADWFAGRGLVLSWQMKHENSLTFLYGIGCAPVRIADLEADGAPREVLGALRSAFAVTAEGNVQRGDTLLMQMSEDRRAAVERFEAGKRAAQERGHVVQSEFEEAIENMQRAVGGTPLKPRPGTNRVPDADAFFTR
jgi:hypothetical protein